MKRAEIESRAVRELVTLKFQELEILDRKISRDATPKIFNLFCGGKQR